MPLWEGKIGQITTPIAEAAPLMEFRGILPIPTVQHTQQERKKQTNLV